MKKIITLISLMLVTCLMVFALASCDGAGVTIGENGNWFIGEEDTGVKASGTNATIGSNGNWYLDGTDTGKKAVGTDAERVTVGENGNWFIGSTDTGVKAVCGKYVVGTASETVTDEKSGKSYVKTVVTYSDGTTETFNNEIPEVIQGISIYAWGEYVAGYKPALELEVMTSTGEYYVDITDDMFIIGKPDFTKAGIYHSVIAYGGRICNATFNVVDATGVTVTGLHVYDNDVAKGTSLDELTIYVEFSNSSSYAVSISDVTVNNAPDLNKEGRYEFELTLGGYTEEAYIEVYDPAKVGNIRYAHVNYDEFIIPYRATAQQIQQIVNDYVIGKQGAVHLYEKMYGTNSIDFVVSADMVDLTGVDSSMLGRGEFKVTVSVAGVGTGIAIIDYKVEADLSSATLVKTYSCSDPMSAGMLGTLSTYDNGVANITGMLGMQGSYTVDANKLTFVSSGMTLLFAVDNTTDTFSVYIPAGEPTASYTNAGEHMKIKVFSDCIVFGMWEPAVDPNPEMFVPIYAMPISVLVDGKINVMGSAITLNSDGTFTMG